MGWGSSPNPPCPGHGPDLLSLHVSGSQQRPKGPLGRLECLAENSPEFQEVVQTFYDTLDSAHSRIRIVRVSLVLILSASWPSGLLALFSPCRACGLSFLLVRASWPGAWRGAGWELLEEGRAPGSQTTPCPEVIHRVWVGETRA